MRLIMLTASETLRVRMIRRPALTFSTQSPAPPEIEWFTNRTNPGTWAAYEFDVKAVH
jgi:hypothetical protein